MLIWKYSSIWKKCSARGMRGLMRSLYLYTQEGYVPPTVLVLAFRGTECKWSICLFKSFFILAVHLCFPETPSCYGEDWPLHGPDWPRTLDPRVSASRVLRLQVCTAATTSSSLHLFWRPTPIAFVISSFSSLSKNYWCSTKWDVQK